MAKVSKCVKTKHKTIHTIYEIDKRIICKCGEYNMSKSKYNSMLNSNLYKIYGNI